VDQVEDTADTYKQHMQQRSARILGSAGGKAAEAGIAHAEIHVEDAEPYRAIIRVAQEKGCDLVAMASHGRRGVGALVLGSETLKVLTHSSIPVLVYRAPGLVQAPAQERDRMREPQMA
jgi:nucleotide-binding universal stress UspA family protein